MSRSKSSRTPRDSTDSVVELRAPDSPLGATRANEAQLAGIDATRTYFTSDSNVAELLDLLSEGFILLDQDGRFVFCNETYREFYSKITDLLVPGTPFETLVRISIERGQIISPQKSVPELIADRLGHFRADASVHEHLLCDGRWLRITERRLPNGWSLGTRTDITEAKVREQKLSAMEQQLTDAIEALQEGFALFDPEDRLVIWNRKYEGFFPLIKDDIRRGVKFEQLIQLAAERGQNVETQSDPDQWIAARRSAHAQATGTFEHQFSDGRYIRVAERKTKDGSTLSTYVDITQLKRRENELHRALVAAETANRTKSDFLAKMSHELRTPLNAIIGFSETMHREILGSIGNPRYREYIKDIYTSGTYLLGLVNDLLDLAKIEANELKLNEETVNLTVVVDSCLRMLLHRAQSAGIQLNSHVSDSPTVFADEKALKKVVLNILTNAVKFTPPGGSIDVSCGYAESGDVVIGVADTGIGISAKDIGRVMEPFVQAAPALDNGGTGLGLTIARSLTELHGGSLKIESAPGEGTTVSIILPRYRRVVPQGS